MAEPEVKDKTLQETSLMKGIQIQQEAKIKEVVEDEKEVEVEARGRGRGRGRGGVDVVTENEVFCDNLTNAKSEEVPPYFDAIFGWLVGYILTKTTMTTISH